jgi:hypothetical protein
MDEWELIDTWDSFGYRYRGHWNSRSIEYAVKDVVSFVIEGQEGHFICKEEHISEVGCTPDKLPEAWDEYDREWRLKKRKPYTVHPHNLV